ncbi:MAG: hypothetical protein V3U87_01535 [Methylococcaceae bacterium]
MVDEVKVEGYDTLTDAEKTNLKKSIASYKNKIKESIKNGTFEKMIKNAFGGNVRNKAELNKLMDAVKNGEWDKVIPKIKLAGDEVFGSAKDSKGNSAIGLGAYNKKSGEILMNKALLAPNAKINGQPVSFEKILTEEIAHSWDAKINNGIDSKGDEGEAFSLLLDKQGILNKTGGKETAETRALDEKISQAKAQNDSGTLTLENGEKIDVEFGLFSSIKKFVKKAVKSVVNVVKNTVKGVVNTVKSFIDDPVNFIKNAIKDPKILLSIVTKFIPGLNVLSPFIDIYTAAKAVKDGNIAGALGAFGNMKFLPPGAQDIVSKASNFNNKYVKYAKMLKDPSQILNLLKGKVNLPPEVSKILNKINAYNTDKFQAFKAALTSKDPLAMAGGMFDIADINRPSFLTESISIRDYLSRIESNPYDLLQSDAAKEILGDQADDFYRYAQKYA